MRKPEKPRKKKKKRSSISVVAQTKWINHHLACLLTNIQLISGQKRQNYLKEQARKNDSGKKIKEVSAGSCNWADVAV